MIALKVERIGDQVAVVLTEEALSALRLAVGDTLCIEPNADGTAREVTPKTWMDDPHARGRVFLRRYNKSFERFEA